MTTDSWIFLAVIIVEIVNVCLLLGLLHVYWGNYRKVKSEFSIGLLFFASVFLLKSILFIIGIVVWASGIHTPISGGDRGVPGLFLLNIVEMVALAILFKITWT